MPTADYSSYHQPNTTTSDGSKFDNFIDAVQATVNALDNNNIAAAAGIVASKLADPTTGKVLGSSGAACAAVYPPGYELHYSEITAAVNVTGTAEGSATSVLPGASVTYDGTAVWLEFWAYAVDTGGNSLSIGFYDGATSLGSGGPQVAGTYYPQMIRRKVTPSAGAHTYNVKAWVTSGTGHVYAGAGGAGAVLPGFIRVTKA